jgi:hypothetical protein
MVVQASAFDIAAEAKLFVFYLGDEELRRHRVTIQLK